MRFWQSVRPAVFDDMPCVVVSYEDDAVFQDITAQKLFGVSGFEGRLPVSASTRFGLVPAYRPRHPAFSAMMLPEKLGFNSIVLFGVDSLGSWSAKEWPRCQKF